MSASTSTRAVLNPGPAIVGDDGVGFADDRGAGDVAVIGIVDPVVVFAVFGCGADGDGRYR